MLHFLCCYDAERIHTTFMFCATFHKITNSFAKVFVLFFFVPENSNLLEIFPFQIWNIQSFTKIIIKKSSILNQLFSLPKKIEHRASLREIDFHFFFSLCPFFANFHLQIQFLIVFCHTIQIQFQPSCNFPKSIGALLSLNAALFTYMFSSFYIKSYRRESRIKKMKKAEELAVDENKNTILQNGNDINHNHVNGNGFLKKEN